LIASVAMIASVGTYLPVWKGPGGTRIAGGDEDAVTLGVAAGLRALGPDDVDVAEVHDCFTGVELISYEDLGFAERFQGHKIVESREHYVGGRIPINPSGGLKAKGHPPGATGVAQCVELFEQLRGESTNQVDGARIALAHNIGGPTAVSAVIHGFEQPCSRRCDAATS
jgi:acetyl-CoA acetyltransferase